MSDFEDVLVKLGLAKPKNRRIERKGAKRSVRGVLELLMFPTAILFGVAIGVFFVVAVVRLINKVPDEISPPAHTVQADAGADAAAVKQKPSKHSAPQASPAKRKKVAAEQKPANTEVAQAKAGPQQSSEEDVRRALMHWAQAWSRRDVGSYLACYAGDFSAADGMSRSAWKAQREARISRPHSIRVTLNKIKISMSGDDAATARFLQSYRADRAAPRGTGKELRLKKENGRWLIVSERVF